MWHAFIKRDIPNGASKIALNTPNNPANWHKVYRKLRREDQKQQEAAEEALRAALNQKKIEKSANQTNIMADTFIPGEGKKATFWNGPRAAPSGSMALRNAKTTADRLAILKRQTANRQQGRSQTQSVPTHELQQRRGAVMQAPRAMVNAYTRTNVNIQKPRVPGPASRPVVFTSRAGPQSQSERAINEAMQRREREEKERKLRSLTGAAQPTTVLAASATSRPNPQTVGRTVSAKVATQPGAVPAAAASARLRASPPQIVRRMVATKVAIQTNTAPSASAPLRANPPQLVRRTFTGPRKSVSPPSASPTGTPTKATDSRRVSLTPSPPARAVPTPSRPAPSSGAPVVRKKRPYEAFLPNKRRKI